MSHRGISALEAAGVGRGLLDTLIPMKGRMIHDSKTGKLSSQNYGYFNEAINSVDRKLVNQHLLTMAEQKKVVLKFQQELLSVDFGKKTLSFKQADGSVVRTTADLIIGSDGAFSRVRREMMRVTRMNYSQKYIDHAYVELSMPPSATGDYQMDPNHLHIWPRHTFMMIALPNIDKSFTVTLFMPWKEFEAIKTPEELLAFFKTHFADSIPLLGSDHLISDFFKNQRGALMSVKCTPYNYKGSCLIIGDAAHAMVPFYGQGMNCGFEDCLVLDQILTKHLGPYAKGRPDDEKLMSALEEYSKVRNPDAEAICDLAMDNYVEMRSSVTSWRYKTRKAVEGFLHRLMPTRVIPLYTMVSFSRIPYSQALQASHRRRALYEAVERTAAYAVAVTGLWMGVWVGGAWWIKHGGGREQLLKLLGER
ncbi:hypothetical protein HDU84_008735 [Entophlyctis sp. JEL0112]|nr:hypothetical protein HDU84_008735 [Entophlyctis sp. JEL0112]